MRHYKTSELMLKDKARKKKTSSVLLIKTTHIQFPVSVTKTLPMWSRLLNQLFTLWKCTY